MLWTIFVILLVLWLLGLVSSYTLGGYIHILLLVARYRSRFQPSERPEEGAVNITDRCESLKFKIRTGAHMKNLAACLVDGLCLDCCPIQRSPVRLARILWIGFKTPPTYSRK